MTDLNIFGKNKKSANGSESGIKNFNIIIADTRWETFEALSEIKENYNFMNLSSEFAVNFILDYEKIDIIIIGLKIGSLEAIAKKAERKKTKVFVIGKDLTYPIDKEEVLSIIKKAYDEKITPKKPGSDMHLMDSFEKIFRPRQGVNASTGNSEDCMTANIKPGNKKHAITKTVGNINSRIWDSNTKQSNIGNIDNGTKGIKDTNTETEDFGDTCDAVANIKDTNTYTASFGNSNRKDENTGLTGFEDINIRSTDAKDIKTGNENSWPSSIKAVNKGVANTKYAGIGHANIKDLCMKSDKEQNKQSQYYNDFWKEVAQKANDGFLDSWDTREIRRPNQNMHEYSKKNDNSNKQRLMNNTSWENESLISVPGKVITIKQKIMVFVKAKGGVGSTFLSLYLAYEFRKLRTLLIDLNFSEGGSDIGYYLGMPKSPNMLIFTEGYNRSSMENSVINFKGHFDVLQPPPSYDLTKKLDMQDIYSIVDIARRKYHLLIFDLPNQINDIFFGVLDMADLTIMVSDCTPGSIGRLASINKRFIYNDMEKILVLNKNKYNNSHSFIKNNISEFINLKEIVSIDENSLLSGKSDFKECDFSNNKDMQGFMKKVMESLTYD
jgi:MinD-like ATPase involved in chromosome partitioning or flagellar assembly